MKTIAYFPAEAILVDGKERHVEEFLFESISASDLFIDQEVRFLRCDEPLDVLALAVRELGTLRGCIVNADRKDADRILGFLGLDCRSRDTKIIVTKNAGFFDSFETDRMARLGHSALSLCAEQPDGGAPILHGADKIMQALAAIINAPVLCPCHPSQARGFLSLKAGAKPRR